MSYFPDLSNHKNKGVNIGWLSKDESFKEGPVPEGFIDRLTTELKVVTRHRGWHTCDFCGQAKSSNVVQAGKYIMPAMILHYIMDHNYQPPQEFIDDIMGDDLIVMIHPDLMLTDLKREELQGLIDNNMIVIGKLNGKATTKVQT